jgi:cell shape-determining protein MreD
MNFLKNKTSAQLKTWNKICFAAAILVLLAMFALLGVALFQISDGTENAVFTALAPSILLPIIFVPILFSALISSEIKKRKR